MREVFGPGIIGCLLLATVFCMPGCVMPSRESLKEQGWNPTTAAGSATSEAAGRTALIKPFIPPGTHDSAGEGAVSMGSGSKTDPPAAAPQLTAAQEAPPAETPLTVPLQPTPRPVRWQAPPEPQDGSQLPPALPDSSQVTRVPDRSAPDVAPRKEAPESSPAAGQVFPPPPSSRPRANHSAKSSGGANHRTRAACQAGAPRPIGPAPRARGSKIRIAGMGGPESQGRGVQDCKKVPWCEKREDLLFREDR